MRLYAKIMHYDQKNYELRVEKIGLQKNSLQIVLFFSVLHTFPGVHKLHHTLSNSCLTVYNLQSSRVTEVRMSSINDV